MKLIFILTTVMALSTLLADGTAHAAPILLGKNDKVSIIVPQNATQPEQTAARELQQYLTKITGGEYTVQVEGSPVNASPSIYVGATQFATRAGLAVAALPSEQWHLKTQGQNLVLAGGGSRGTLYAAYRFLEDVGGVRWWNAYEETVPTRETLQIEEMNRSGKPVFAYRDIYETYAGDNGRFAIRNRLNRDGDSPISAQYGGSRAYGPPYHVHTFYLILSPEKYDEKHPEWFRVPGGGKPTALNSQLVMSNPEMRREFLKLLRELIIKARQDAQAKGLPAPDVFSVSQEDNNITFAAPGDEKLVEENGGADAAVLIDFINYLADGIKDEFPDIYIDTLAYYSGEKAPAKIRPRDNVIVRLTDTTSNLLLPVTHPCNHAFHDNLVAWSKITKNLRVWDYAVTYTVPGLPIPTARTFAPDLRYYRDHHVEGVFVEHEYPVNADMRDLKIWLLCKLLENPDRDYDALVQEFTDGFYGAGGKFVRQYLKALEDAADAIQPTPNVSWFAPLNDHSYLTLEFVTRANAIFDEAARAVAGDETLSRRVRHARLPLDRAAMLLTPRWVRQQRVAVEALPLKVQEIADRFLQTSNEQIEMRFAAVDHPAQRKAALNEATITLEILQGSVKIPARFGDIDPSRVVVYSPRETRNFGNAAKVVADPQAGGGVVSRMPVSAEGFDTYKLPMPWGVFDVNEKKELLKAQIKPEDIPGTGYHWHKLGTGQLTDNAYIYFLRNWYIQLDLSGLDAESLKHQYEIWANVKFSGSVSPHTQPDEQSAISVGQVVLVRK